MLQIRNSFDASMQSSFSNYEVDCLGPELAYPQHGTFWQPQISSNPPESCWNSMPYLSWSICNIVDDFHHSPEARECETVPSAAFVSALMSPESNTCQTAAYTPNYSSYELQSTDTSANVPVPATQCAAPVPHVSIRFFTSAPTQHDRTDSLGSHSDCLTDPTRLYSAHQLPTRLGSSASHCGLYSTLEQDMQPVGDNFVSSDPSSRCDTPTTLNDSTGSLSDSNSFSDSESESENDSRPPTLNRLLYRSARLRGALQPDTQRPPSSRVAKPVKKLCDVPFVSRFTVNKCRKRPASTGSKRLRKSLPADVAAAAAASEVDLSMPKEWTFVEMMPESSRMSPSLLDE